MNQEASPLRRPPTAQPFVIIGLVVAGLDLSLLTWLGHSPGELAHHQTASFLLAAGTGFLLLLRGPWRAAGYPFWRRLPALLTILLLVLFLRGGLLASLLLLTSFPAALAQSVTAVFSAVIFLAACAVYLPPQVTGSGSEERWQRLVLGAILYSVLLRLAYLGVPELLFEEAYYWNYAQHLDIGYLDHPLMVAWTIKPFISLLGNNEFAVRAGAFLFWFVTAFFSYRLARGIFDKAIAWRTVLLLAVLPAYFSFGFFISPDAPLTAFWAMAAYFAYRALIHDEGRAWLGLGIALGLGMISKYTIALLGAAVVLYVIVHRPARKWLRRPEPYVALAVALLLLSPVVIWNMQHDWASFAFQSQGRLVSKSVFSLPRLLLNVLILLTPVGLVSALAVLIQRRAVFASLPAVPEKTKEGCRLLIWLTLFPLLVFAALSLTKASKLNWTGPLWLPLLPLLALLLGEQPIRNGGKVLRWCQRAWPKTALLCLLFYAAAFQYLGPGLPALRYPQNVHLIGWRDFGPAIEAVVSRLERERGEQILVAGLDRNRIASGLAFYRAYGQPEDGAMRNPAFTTASEHLFGEVGLMYEFWFPAAQQAGKTLLLVAADRSHLERDAVRSRVTGLGPIQSIALHKNGRPAGQFFYRLALGYHPQPMNPETGRTSPATQPVDVDE